MARYAGGSLLARYFAWVRVPDPSSRGGAPFEGMLMENVARPPPGVARGTELPFAPFDMKGIRLYDHERRFEATFGRRGLKVPARTLASLTKALDADVELLTSQNLVDYSFLLTAVATAPASPTECGGGASDRPSGGGGEAGAARGAARGAEERAPVVPPRLLQACYCRHVAAASASDTAAAAATTTITATTASSTSSTASASSAAPYESTEATETAEAGKAGAAPSLECSHVLARLAVIDYLRGWRLVEARRETSPLRARFLHTPPRLSTPEARVPRARDLIPPLFGFACAEARCEAVHDPCRSLPARRASTCARASPVTSSRANATTPSSRCATSHAPFARTSTARCWRRCSGGRPPSAWPAAGSRACCAARGAARATGLRRLHHGWASGRRGWAQGCTRGSGGCVASGARTSCEKDERH